MNDSEFQSFCYEEYKRSLSSAEDIYRRYPLAVTALVILATATITLGSNDYLPLLFDRVDVTLYYAGITLSLLSTACSTILLLLSVFPKDYEHLDSPLAFRSWRETYRGDLVKEGYSPEEAAKHVSEETKSALTLRFVEATDKNLRTDRARMRAYNRAMYAIGVSVVSLGIAAVFFWTISLRGIS